MKTIEELMLKRVRGRGRGSAVTPADFLDLGKRAAVDQGLSRLTRKKMLMRVSRGLYALPEINEWIGEVSPAPDEVAKALARRGSSKLLPSGALAANLLGLSDQVPAKAEYLTDGPSCRVMIKRLTVVLKQTTPKMSTLKFGMTKVLLVLVFFFGCLGHFFLYPLKISEFSVSMTRLRNI